MSDAYRRALDVSRDAIDELTASVEHLKAVAEAEGQGDPALPLIISNWDGDLGRAVRRELEAWELVKDAWRLVDAARPPFPG